MSYTRQRYDREAYQEEIGRSTDPMLYRLDSNYAVNCKKCFGPYGPGFTMGSTVATDNGAAIDLDSILRGVSKIHSKSNIQQIPDSINPYKPDTRILPDCNEALESEYTRFTYPAYDIRGLTVRDLRFDYPLFDPQCQIFEDFAVNTKLQAKDNFRAIWQIPVDQRDLFPTERLGRVKNCNVDLECRYAPYNG